MPRVLERPAARSDLRQKDFTPDRLAAEIAALATDPQKLGNGRGRSFAGRSDAAERLAELVLKVAGVAR